MSDRKFTITTPYTFAELCNNLHKFRIPPYQRSYSWKQKQINELWESMITSENNYFIGNLVFLEATSDSEDRFEIIDGQQRLFTISLLLASIRNEYMGISVKTTTEEDWKRKRINDIDDKMLLYNEDKFPFKESLRLLPGKENLMQVYQVIIENNQEALAKINSEHDDNKLLFIRNFKVLKNLVTEYISEGKKLERLDQLLEKISNLLFIVIVCSSDNDAFEIFEGLNSTGIDLTVSDLIKNAVIQAAKTSTSRISAEAKWNEIESLFESTSIPMFSRFLRHQWISEEGYVTGNKLFKVIKEKKLKNKEGHEIVAYVDELLKDVKTYVGFRDVRQESYLLNNISLSSLEIIRNFRLLDIEQIYEVILAYYKKKINTKEYTDRIFNRDLSNLWIFAFRAKILSINPSDYERKFAEHCVTVREFKGEEYEDMSKEFNKILRDLVKDDDNFIEKFPTELEYTSESALIKFILSKLMTFYDKEIKFSKPTIEHILPQDPTKWKLTKEEVKDYVEHIGNLTLLHDNDNSKAGNETMKYKYENVYSKSAFKFNQNLKEWVDKFQEDYKSAIEERGLSLAKEINKLWEIK
jgi:uncharacterized protein with ParB-like and HNH nuclease domain